MTAQEKAQDLVNKLVKIQEQIEWTDDKQLMKYYWYQEAKKSALIAVDEIIRAPHENLYTELVPSDAEETDWFWDKFDEYWKEVKQEIEKL